MQNKTNYIPAEEVCTRLNQELKSNVFTFGKFMRLVKKGLIKFHDVRTPGTTQPRYAFIFEEVKASIELLQI
ncbi:MAG: hypothetical protein WC667_05125 [Sulfurimonas sp.]|jgi:hypothetical protein